MSLLLLIFTSFLIVLWTVRLARSKGRQPWMWGGAALLLSVIPDYALISIVPLVILLFMKRRQDPVDAGSAPPLCPKCAALRSEDQSYCVNCGWELARAYGGETSADDAQVGAPSGPEHAEPSVANADLAPVHSIEAEANPIAEAGSAGQAEPIPLEPAGQDAPSGTPAESPEEVPAEPVVRRRRGVPTATSMTQWGIDLFDLGRIQESVDQFTKAIALDPDFKMAWERRAESYAKLGRGEEAAEDRRRLRALNASPSAG
ncbi:MAG: hypothetical protein IIB30_05180 [Chloroflexi bacterium]|nr:hypothetical protein [Chloroflexota bacterium]MCH8225863.1 hypothetical protein [Chloroflexota bacterium]MCI0846625.1 hypothetical protein [Chloroflexota bacterium]